MYYSENLQFTLNNPYVVHDAPALQVALSLGEFRKTRMGARARLRLNRLWELMAAKALLP
jgi:hypothetical protein